MPHCRNCSDPKSNRKINNATLPEQFQNPISFYCILELCWQCGIFCFSIVFWNCVDSVIFFVFLLYFGTVLTVWYFLFFYCILELCWQCGIFCFSIVFWNCVDSVVFFVFLLYFIEKQKIPHCQHSSKIQ
jgi:hypothetical protein